MSQVLIKFGEYRNIPVINTKFTLVKGFQQGKKGAYVTVKNDGNFPIAIDVVKVKVNNVSNIEYLDGEPMTEVAFKPKVATVTETDEEAMNRMWMPDPTMTLLSLASAADIFSR